MSAPFHHLQRLLGALPAPLHAGATRRLDAQHARLHASLARLYGASAGFDDWFGDLLAEVGHAWAARPAPLHALDAAREAQPDWFCSERMLGYCCYAERFGGALAGVGERVDYLAELGVRYLHLLPFLHARAGENDGGFAVASFEEVEPALGTNADLEALCARLRAANISLCADLVLNHVADDHAWARGAAAGDAALRDYFHVLPERAAVEQFEATLGQVFPLAAPGNFTYVAAMGGWVWTTFYPYQWDLNYSNRNVFSAMVGTLLRLANRGVEVFRLDSIAYLWKRAGTSCTNQGEVHELLAALRAIVAIAAPGVLLKAEAIMPTAALPAYFGAPGAPACHLAYHSTLMAAGWAALAEQDTRILRRVVAGTPALPPHASWLTYVRCHDDIGWPILQAEAGAPARVAALARFFNGTDPASFAAGVPFQGGDGRPACASNGMAAALAGVEPRQAAATQADALARVLLVYGLALVFGGLPVIYMGDELGMGNDPAFDWAGQADTRWVQRPHLDGASLAARHDPASVAGALFSALRRLVALRAALPALAAQAPRQLLTAPQPALLALARGRDFLCLANFSAAPLALEPNQCGAGTPALLAPWSMQWLRRAAADDGSASPWVRLA